MNGELQKISLFILGNYSVGKTSFINKYVKNEFNQNCRNTIGIDYCSKLIQLPTGEKLELLFYDTAGQEKFKAISFNIINNADGIILMYDITNRSSFDDFNQWIESIKEAKGDNCPLILIGNKCDLEQRVITQIEGELLANKHGFSFEETSSKEGTNIKESVQLLILDIMKNKKLSRMKETEEYDILKTKPSFKISSNKKKEKKKKCCK